ncbi:MAG: gliding motility-associated C-terminal domain-containing protein [Bacteroidota bacterium]
MKISINKIVALSFSFFITFSILSQITPNGNSGSTTTNYTSGAQNDPIYIWCADGLSNNTASLTANAPSGSAPYTFNWFFHDQTNFSWTPYVTQTGTSSTINNLPSDGYRVQIYDAGNNLVGCYIAWVWNMNSDVTASNNPSACNATGLSGTINANGSFTYYNPPPPESIITPATTITVCFSANHTYVSDLGFYLIGPAACGSPIVTLMPHPQLINALNGCCCNSGNNVNNLCFTTNLVGNISPCTAGAPLTGTYSGYASAYGNNTTINWSPLYGCNAAEGGWRVQIFDCIGADVGALTNATLTFSNLTSFCGSPTTISYTSGSINSAINDNSCSQGVASIFQVPITPNLTTPITINANVSYLWSSVPAVSIPNASTSLTPAVTNLPTGTTNFTLTANISYGSVNCTNSEVTAFVQTCCTAVSDAGSDVSFCTGANANIGTPAVANMSYSWSPATGLSDPTTAQPTVTLTNTGSSPQSTTYTLTVTNTVDGGCTDADEVVVTVNPLPTVNAGTYPVSCSDAADIDLVGSPVGGTFSGAGVTGSAFDPSVGTQTVTYSYTDGNNCSNTATATITVVDPSSTSAGTYSPVCIDGANVVLTGTPPGGVFSGTGVTGNSFDPSAGTQTITYDYTDANGCSGTANTTITVNPLPIVNAGADAVICADGATVLLASGTGSPAWTPSNGLSSATVLNPSASPSATTTYTLTLTENGCSDSDDITVTVFPNPAVSITGDQAICSGECTTLEVSGADFYTWAPSPDITDPLGTSQDVCPTTTTTYEVTGFSVSANSVINGDFSGGAVGFSSDYSLSADTQPESTYFVTTDANLTHPGFTGIDHTTGTGNFMVVNGSGTPNTSVWCQTVTVQPNTDYVFSTWVSTLAVGSPAVLQFSINGNTIGTPFTAPLFTGEWDEFYSTWNSGSATSATICIVNQNTAVGGNDFGLDDIFFSALCSSTESFTVTVNPLPTINAGADITLCQGESVTLTGSNGSSYTWSGGAVDGQPFVPAASGTYTVSGTDVNGCVNTDQLTVTLLNPPVSDFTADSLTGYPGLTVEFTNESQDASSYVWVFGNGQLASVSTTAGQNATYGSPGTYTVYLIADNGYCTDSSSLDIIVIPFPDPIIHVPNVFTPNGDGTNDVFFIASQYVETLEISIFNRWGNEMREVNGINDSWDGTVNGKDAEEGTYFFKYYAKGINGTELTGHGNVTLNR